MSTPTAPPPARPPPPPPRGVRQVQARRPRGLDHPAFPTCSLRMRIAASGKPTCSASTRRLTAWRSAERRCACAGPRPWRPASRRAANRRPQSRRARAWRKRAGRAEPPSTEAHAGRRRSPAGFGAGQGGRLRALSRLSGMLHAPSPAQPRDALGELEASAERGLFFGNRGGASSTIRRRAPSGADPGRAAVDHLRLRLQGAHASLPRRRAAGLADALHRAVLLRRVTALAAGHRPARSAGATPASPTAGAGRGGRVPGLAPLPRGGRAARRRAARGRAKRLHRMEAAELPDGAMVAMAGRAFAVRDGALLEWSQGGYLAAAPLPRPSTC